MDMTPQTWPEWYDGRHINEVLFCQQFLETGTFDRGGGALQPLLQVKGASV